MKRARVEAAVLLHQPDPTVKKLQGNFSLTFEEAMDYAVVKSRNSNLHLSLDDTFPKYRADALAAKQKMEPTAYEGQVDETLEPYMPHLRRVVRSFRTRETPTVHMGKEIHAVVSQVWKEELTAFGGEGKIVPKGDLLRLVIPIF